jgi:hypothetical protein
MVILLTIAFCFNGWAADKEAIEKQIKKQVDEVVAGIDSGKKVEDYKILATKEPYHIFVMEQGGKILLHPSLEGDDMKNQYRASYDAVIKATVEGLWVEYEYFGKVKRSYVKRTKGGLIVGSGYSD